LSVVQLSVLSQRSQQAVFLFRWKSFRLGCDRGSPKLCRSHHPWGSVVSFRL